MGQQESRAAFDNLLTKSHVGHALIHHGDQHNDIPTVYLLPLVDEPLFAWLILSKAPSHDPLPQWHSGATGSGL